MPYSKIFSAGVEGLDGYLAEVEVDISKGLPGFALVGLASKAVDEAKDRVRGALKNSGYKIPADKLTVNLAPADIRKEGTHYDVAIAICILSSLGEIEKNQLLKQTIFAGELSLDGRVRRVSGALSIAELAQKKHAKYLVLPHGNLEEASLVKGIKLVPIKNLKELINMLALGKLTIKRKKIDIPSTAYENDFSLIRGNENAKRALEIAAAGGHNILLSGPPGTGKTLLARALPSIMPSLNETEQLEVTKIYSVSGKLKLSEPVIFRPPFRSPHHSASHIALVGGGAHVNPGEVTLAHRGILFLDEIPEFHRQTLEALRQPLEDGVITVSRAQKTITFPAKFMLVASSNPCPCGFLGDPKKECVCTPVQILKYQKKLSGPLLDRIDMKIFVERFEIKKLISQAQEDNSQKIRRKVERARQIQQKKYQSLDIGTNSELGIKQIDKYCQAPQKEKELLLRALENANLSARGYHKILKIARTIADLEGKERITQNHLFEAMAYYENKQLNG